MKRIVVTGGSGRLGIKVVEQLRADGFDVLAVDIKNPDTPSGRFMQVDLMDSSAVTDVLKGMDAVIHLGAIPGPLSHPQPVTFRNNVMSTWNVAEAAAVHELQRVVFASSLFTIGWHESADAYWPQYVPVDENHPLTPFEAYGLSKVVGEEILASMSRRTGIPSVSLRITNIIQEEQSSALPWPVPNDTNPARFVLWPYTEINDAAAACALALKADTRGHEPFFIAAEDIRFDANTRELLQRFAPAVQIRGPLLESASVISIDKAKRMLGFQPVSSWKTAAK